jgi:pimeloyl-ACP methyl ester carboxylesterase
MKESRSQYVEIRGLKYHVRSWGSEGNPKLFMLHGFQDVSASWQFTVDALQNDWHVIAPDWRGYGLTEWSGQDTYWMPDLVADLDALLDEFEPDVPAAIVAHSMGANTAALYSGAVPKRVRKFVNVEGLGGAPSRAEDAPRRFAKWLQQIVRGEEQRPYESFEDFAERMIAENPRLTPERAAFLVQHWGKQEDDGVVRRADPAHKVMRPQATREDEMLACWRAIRAPVLWIEGAESDAVAATRSRPGVYEERIGAMQSLAGVERVEGAGHNVHHDQPEALAALIEKFLLG